ncbi:MAG: hypothetical protein EYC70_05140 [Planctomycetota bacterium]|nr:MAG: hypothetical protein EYC70_05140 [Planctomycetota bacterium]
MSGTEVGGQDAGADWATDFDRRILQELAAVVETEHIVFHYRAGDLSEAQLTEDVAANVAYYAELEDKLRMRYQGRIHVFLYRDKEDMNTRTEGAGDIAFSTGTVSVHQVRDFRGVHELTHIFALQFPEVADAAGPDPFLTEGLATAMAESDQNVPVHSWAAVYQRAGRLPALDALRCSFPEGAPPGVHPYHVAASFVLYLVERFGIETVKAYYRNSTEAGLVFGVTLPRLERDWRESLERIEVAPEHVAHVLDRLGLRGDPLPAEWAHAEGTVLFDGSALDALAPDEPGRWTLRDGVLVGSHDGPWTAIHSRQVFGADVGVRLRLRLVAGDAVQVRLNRTPGHESQAIFARWCTYMSEGEDNFKPNEGVKIPPGVWCDIVFANTGGRGRLYLNGIQVLDHEDVLLRQEGQVGLCVERGVVEVASFTVFTP